MTRQDLPRLARALALLSEAFSEPVTELRAEAYFIALEDLPIEGVEGVGRAALNCKFFPRPADLRALIVGDDEDQTEQAWMLFKKAMRQVGSYASIVTMDAALGEAIIACFDGWPEACAAELSPETWSSKRKEFGRVYRVLRDRIPSGTRYLSGWCERQNDGHPEWLGHITVGVLEGTTIRTIRGDQAEDFRAQIAATRRGQFESFTPEKALPPLSEDVQ